MRELQLTVPELAMVAGTRAILGAGLGLLLADRLPEGHRKALGWTLFPHRSRHHRTPGVGSPGKSPRLPCVRVAGARQSRSLTEHWPDRPRE